METGAKQTDHLNTTLGLAYVSAHFISGELAGSRRGMALTSPTNRQPGHAGPSAEVCPYQIYLFENRYRPRFILEESEYVRRRRNPMLVWYDSRDGPSF
ncbi:MAG: hypothetical protein M1319_05840 [Chloroflexi bacterium]|nr:hypothetical protein [Chloroflexota bacterium]